MKTSQEYLVELKNELSKVLPKEEAINAWNFFEEYITEAKLEDYQSVVKKLGTPKEVSFNAIIDYKEEQLNETPDKTKLNWLLLIALVLSAPVSIPLVLSALSIVLSSLIVIAVWVGMVYLLDALLWFIGATFSVVSIVTFTQDIPTGFFHLGIGLSLLALAWIVTPILITITRKISVGTYKFMLNKLRPKKQSEVSYVE